VIKVPANKFGLTKHKKYEKQGNMTSPKVNNLTETDTEQSEEEESP
jgi:hypothetical protein